MKARLDIRVSTGAAENVIGGWMGDKLKIRVTAAPEKGKANKAVIRLLSRELGIPASRIVLTKGTTSSNKTIEVDGLSSDELNRKLRSGD